MTVYNPHIIDIKTIHDAKRAIKEIGSDPQSIEIMAPKAILKVIKLNRHYTRPKNIANELSVILKDIK